MHVSGLCNGQPYAFAVATKTSDGQTSAQSAITCAIPSANGEYELDGTLLGKNTSCSVSSLGAPGALPWVVAESAFQAATGSASIAVEVACADR